MRGKVVTRLLLLGNLNVGLGFVTSPAQVAPWASFSPSPHTMGTLSCALNPAANRRPLDLSRRSTPFWRDPSDDLTVIGVTSSRIRSSAAPWLRSELGDWSGRGNRGGECASVGMESRGRGFQTGLEGVCKVVRESVLFGMMCSNPCR